MASTAASTPRSSGTSAARLPSTSMRPLRATSVAAGRRPMNENRLHRSCSTDSSRNPGSSPTQRRKAATGVTRSASTSRHTGTTVDSRASRLNSSRVGWITSVSEGAEETAVRAGVARALALLVDDEQHRVAVTVVVRLADPLAVAGRVALGPALLSAPAPEHCPPRLEGLAQRGLVGPGHHQHVARGGLLHHAAHEAVRVVPDLGQLVLSGGDRHR